MPAAATGTYHVGDTISTAFFDFTVNSAVASADHEGYTAQDGYKLVVADLIYQEHRDLFHANGTI